MPCFPFILVYCVFLHFYCAVNHLRFKCKSSLPRTISSLLCRYLYNYYFCVFMYNKEEFKQTYLCLSRKLKFATLVGHAAFTIVKRLFFTHMRDTFLNLCDICIPLIINYRTDVVPVVLTEYHCISDL